MKGPYSQNFLRSIFWMGCIIARVKTPFETKKRNPWLKNDR